MSLRHLCLILPNVNVPCVVQTVANDPRSSVTRMGVPRVVDLWRPRCLGRTSPRSHTAYLDVATAWEGSAPTSVSSAIEVFSVDDAERGWLRPVIHALER